MKSVLFVNIVVLLFFAIYPAHAAFADPCKESKEIWRQRIQFDIDMRNKRIQLRQKLIELRIQDNELEKQMVALDERILQTDNESAMNNLWGQYDDLNSRREVINKEMANVHGEYSKVSYERANNKLAMQIRRMDKRYECVLNGELNKKLDKLIPRLESDKSIKSEDASRFKALVSERKAVMENLKREYKGSRKAIDSLGLELSYVGDLLKKSNEMSSRLEDKEDELYNVIYERFEKMGEVLERYSDELAAKSEELASYTSLLGK